MNGSIEQILKEFDLSSADKNGSVKLEPVTFWLPSDYKIKYDLLQSKSKSRFGKLLKEVLKRSIDTVGVDFE